MKVIGIDNDGCLICFDPEAEPDQVYNCGETPEEFGIENLTDEELENITPMWPTKD